jgi:hypothetical protein
MVRLSYRPLTRAHAKAPHALVLDELGLRSDDGLVAPTLELLPVAPLTSSADGLHGIPLGLLELGYALLERHRIRVPARYG